MAYFLTNSGLPSVINILRRETAKLTLPSVSEFSRDSQDPFLVLISCILSLRTKDATTRQASLRLFALADSVRKMSELPRRKIEKAIYPVGFYRNKAAAIKGICRDLIEKFDSHVPDSIEGLLSLKGVGRKTANLVLTEGFGKLGVCVDTHVHRISNRLGYCKSKTPQETEECLRKKLPKNYWIEINRLLVIWGQNICRPVSPLCSKCAIERYCPKINVQKHR